MDLLPHAFLFRFVAAAPHVAGLPRKGRWPVGNDVPPLPLFSELDRPSPEIALRAGWNAAGLGLSLIVGGKRTPPQATADDPAGGDGLHVWIDTRNTQNAHRAGRFCHRFALLPAVGRGKSVRAVAAAVEIPRSTVTTLADAAPVRLEVDLVKDGYRLEAWIPAEVLHGYDPESSPRLGFHAVVKDGELGDRPLTVGDAFPTDHDPSLWTTLELTRD